MLKILLLGGSKFMGLDLLEKLSNLPNSLIIVVNRGKTHWNGLFYDIIQKNTNILHIKADRDAPNDFKNKLGEIKEILFKTAGVTQSGMLLDYIIDFSCFKPSECNNLLEVFKGLFKTYIFISTDSTYNASELSLERTEEYFLNYSDMTKIPLVDEGCAFMTNDKEVRKKLKARDSYGYYKLKCEKVNNCLSSISESSLKNTQKVISSHLDFLM